MAQSPPTDYENTVIEICPLRTDESMHSWTIFDVHGRWLGTGAVAGSRDNAVHAANRCLEILKSNRKDTHND